MSKDPWKEAREKTVTSPEQIAAYNRTVFGPDDEEEDEEEDEIKAYGEAMEAMVEAALSEEYPISDAELDYAEASRKKASSCEDCGEPVYRDGLCLECWNIAASEPGGAA